jgi:hypothetical protein
MLGYAGASWSQLEKGGRRRSRKENQGAAGVRNQRKEDASGPDYDLSRPSIEGTLDRPGHGPSRALTPDRSETPPRAAHSPAPEYSPGRNLQLSVSESRVPWAGPALTFDSLSDPETARHRMPVGHGHGTARALS